MHVQCGVTSGGKANFGRDNWDTAGGVLGVKNVLASTEEQSSSPLPEYFFPSPTPLGLLCYNCLAVLAVNWLFYAYPDA